MNNNFNEIIKLFFDIEEPKKEVKKEPKQEKQWVKNEEITKLDYFAAQVLQMWKVSDEDIVKIPGGAPVLHGIIATFCFDLAEAMAKESAKRNK